MNLTDEQLQAAEEGPVTVEAHGKEFVLISRDLYDRAKRATLDGSPLTPEEEEAAFRHAGELAGWEDPELDVYNRFAPENP